MGELTKILQEFDIRFADPEDEEDRTEFSFGAEDGEDMDGDDDDKFTPSLDDGEGEEGDDGDHGEMDFGDSDDMDPDMDHGDEEDTFAGEKRVDITDKLRKMLGLDDNGEEMSDDDQERFTPSLSDLDLDSEEDEDDDSEFDFDVFNKRGTE